MLRRLSEFARHGPESGDPHHVYVTKVLFNIQCKSFLKYHLTVLKCDAVIAIRMNPSNLIDRNSTISGCFVCAGKIASSTDKGLTRIVIGDWEAEYCEKLSLVIDMLATSDGKFQVVHLCEILNKL
jgi:hypothetical protein